MTGARSRAPSSGLIQLTGLGPLGEDLSGQNGECRRVCRVVGHSDWIFKEYLAPVPLHEARRLSRLIGLPGEMKSADQALVSAHTSWPLARVTDGQQRTVGVLLPLAPDTFSTTWTFASGRTKRKPLEVDVLALSESDQVKRRLPPQTLADRVAVCASIAAVAALFERWNLVYLDWSYANIFWSVDDHSAFVIDLDGCSFGPRKQIQTHNWDDPLVPRGGDAGNASDRYRLALLTARCLTGMRTDLAETRAGLSHMHDRGGAIGLVAELLLQALKTQTTDGRPSIARLSRALERARKEADPNVSPAAPGSPASGQGRVTGWTPVNKPGAKPTVTSPRTKTGYGGTAPRPTGPIGPTARPRTTVPAGPTAPGLRAASSANGYPAAPAPGVPVPHSSGALPAVLIVMFLLILVGLILAFTL
jgi:hypothetical protein